MRNSIVFLYRAQTTPHKNYLAQARYFNKAQSMVKYVHSFKVRLPQTKLCVQHFLRCANKKDYQFFFYFLSPYVFKCVLTEKLCDYVNIKNIELIFIIVCDSHPRTNNMNCPRKNAHHNDTCKCFRRVFSPIS